MAGCADRKKWLLLLDGRPWTLIVALALAYFLLAEIGQLLVPAGGRASPLWPAAGIAVAALMVWGRRVWPGVWIGCLASQYWLEHSFITLFMSVAIASGATAQAILGARLAQHSIRSGKYPVSEREVLRFLLLAGPLSCLISATVAVAALYSSGVIGKESVAIEWLIWWVGDSLGVILIAPIMMLAMPNSGIAHITDGRLVLPLVITLILIGAGYIGLIYMERQWSHQKFEGIAKDIDDSGVHQLPIVFQGIKGLERFFTSSERVTADEFRTYVAHMMRRPEIVSIDWAPRVKHKDRKKFEALLSVSEQNSGIFEVNEKFNRIPARERPDYYPVMYNECPGECESIIGLDHGFEPKRRAAMNRARDTGRIEMVSSQLIRSRKDGILIFFPVYELDILRGNTTLRGSREALEGFVIAEVDSDALFIPFYESAEEQQIRYRITDITHEHPGRVIADSIGDSGQIDWSMTEHTANRTWRLDLDVRDDWQQPWSSLPARYYIVFSTLAAFLIAYSTLASAGRQTVTSIEVRNRTEDLRQALRGRRAAEIEERRAKDDLKTTLYSIGDGILVVDADGRIARMNPVAENLTGWKSDDACGHPVDDVFHILNEQARTSVHIPVDEVLHTGEKRNLANQSVLISREGTETPIADSAAPILDQDGQVHGVVIVFRDVSETRAYQNTLSKLNSRLENLVIEKSSALAEVRRSEKNLNLLINNMPHCMILINEDGVIQHANPATLGLLGYQPEELTGRNVATLMPEPHRSNHDDYIQRYLTNKEPRLIGSIREVEAQHSDGATIPVELSISEIEKEGRPHFIGMLHDIRERKQYETALLQRENQLRRAVQAAPYPIMLHAEDGEVLLVNRAWTEVSGYAHDDIPTVEAWSELAYHQSAPEVRQFINELFEIDGVQHDGVFDVHSPHKGWLKWDFSSAPLGYLPDGRRFIISMAVDITQERRLHEELIEAKHSAEQASRAKSAFLATMSHEIRTPLNGVLGMLDVVLHDAMDDQHRDALKTIIDSATMLKNLIDDILDFSKIDSGTFELECIRVSIEEIVEDVCYSILAIAEEKGVDISLFVDPAVPEYILSDPTRLRQVLYNIIGNAIKFSGNQVDSPGRVRVTVHSSSHSDEMVIQVQDNGIGIEPDALGRLFKPFMQGEISTSRHYGGTGLGLAISDRIISRMGGRIEVTGVPGEGATFKVVLPVDKAEPSDSRRFDTLENTQCILVENDNLYVADDVEVYLENAGAEVERVSSEQDALPIVEYMLSPVVICGTERNGIDQMLASFREKLSGHTSGCCIIITTGRRSHPRSETPDCVTLDSSVLSRKGLLQAVSVAAGKTSLDAFDRRSADSTIPISRPAPDIAQARSEGRLILVAEDDPINQKVILRQLELLGYAAELAGNGEEALDMYRRGRYGLLITDVHMPKVDGYQLVSTIRGEESTNSHLPVIALTADVLRDTKKNLFNAGMDDYISKPVPLHFLESVLHQWLPLPAESESSVAEHPAPTITADLDISVLEAMVGNEPAVVESLLQDYLASVETLSKQLEEYFGEGDIASMTAVAHKLKSSSRSVGALNFGDICAQLENACKRTDNSEIQEQMAKIRGLLPRLYQSITTQLNG